MDKKLKEKLITALKSAGMSEGLAEAFEEQEEGAINKFIDSIKPQTSTTIEDVVKSSAFEKYLEENGLDGLLTNNKKAQSEFDKKVSKALSTFQKNLLGEEEPAKSKQKDVNVDSTSGASEEVLKMLQVMSEEIKTLKSEKQKDSKMENARKILNGSKIPTKVQEKWLNRINFDAEKTIEDQVQELESEYIELVGENSSSNKGYNFDQSRQTRSGDIKKSDEKELAEYAKKL